MIKQARPVLSFHLADFAIHQPTIPQPLPEVPEETGETVKEAEFEEVADAEIGDGAEVARQFVVLRLAWISPDAGLQTLNCLLRFALGVATMLFLPPLQRIKVVVIKHNWHGQLLALKDNVDKDSMAAPAFLMVLTGTEFAYRRTDGVFVVPLGCLVN